MHTRRIFWTILLLILLSCPAWSQRFMVSGTVVDADSRQPIEFASILMKDNGLWAVSGSDGSFTIKDVPAGPTTISIQSLGYATRTLTLDMKRDIPRMRISLKSADLKLEGITVTARRKTDEATTSYTIDRTALDQQQLLNIGDIGALLPGGKTVNPTLMSDDRIALRSGSQEKGNASFGTAIEVDGARLDNNAAAGETLAASTRSISTSNIESVEIVTGIPSVEYGDLSNGVVRVNTRRGKSPFIVEGRLNQQNRQIAVSKGFDLGTGRGVLNASLEHARSLSDAASPYTAYQRNILTLNYSNTFFRDRHPLTLNLGLTGNIGGYNSESDPDNDLDDYQRVRDNALRGHAELSWLLNKPWITNVQLRASLALTDRKSEQYAHASSASTQPYLHTTEEGYAMAQDYDELLNRGTDLSATNAIILGPTGYWYVKSFNDSKPMNWQVKLKADWTRRFGRVLNKLMAGLDYAGSQNNGRGSYYDDMRYAPTWREYRYDRLPAMHNLALYAEDKVTIPTTRLAQLELTAGLREDLTMIGGSDYGTVGSLSPRVNGRYLFWRNRRTRWVSELSVHAGWGRSVKLPSFQVLYPAPGYADRLAFASTSTADNRSYYAYHTYPTQARYNPDLHWQFTDQTDLGLEMNVKGTRIHLSAFYHRTSRPYMSARAYSPMSYSYTPPASLNACSIDAADRQYAVDRQTGIVTVGDRSGLLPAEQLAATTRNTYAVNSHYVNGSPVSRYGVEWAVDFAQIQALRTSLRLDGHYYYYKGVDDVLFADIPLGVSTTQADGQPYSYVGYYRGSASTGAGSVASASVSNGSLSKTVSLNATLTTHIPRIRLIVALRLETTLYDYRRQLSELADGGSRGYVLESNADYFGTPYDGSGENHFLAVYPEYYATWDRPAELIPFAERFAWARDNDPALFSDLARLVVRSNYAYVMNPNRISAYYSANLSVTKEIGRHVAVSFYANNFLNSLRTVHSSQTGLDTSLFGSSYIPGYFYGLALKLKV